MKKNNRRDFIKVGVVTGVSMMAASSHAMNSTPKEIKGPFYPITPQADKDFDLTQVDGQTGVAEGDVVEIMGRVLDTEGNPIPDATVDIWQANAAGRYRHPHDNNDAPLDPFFQGWAIVSSGTEGAFRFKTIIPGAYPVMPNWTRPPHIHFKVSKAGFHELITQMYFPDHPLNDVDHLLQGKSKAEQAMMVAKEVRDQVLSYDIVLNQV